MTTDPVPTPEKLAPHSTRCSPRNGVGVSETKLVPLPDPELRPVFTPFISLDDTRPEPPDLLTTRVP